jgi:hypothetical protein
MSKEQALQEEPATLQTKINSATVAEINCPIDKV